MVEYQFIVNLLMGVLMVVCTWFLNSIHGSLKELRESDADLSDRITDVLKNYVLRDEWHRANDLIFARADRIEDALHRKVERISMEGGKQ